LPNLGELNSYMYQHNLVEPIQDNWESFRVMLAPFVDCWWHGAELKFEQTELCLKVFVADNLIIEFRYDKAMSHPLTVSCLDVSEGEMDTDHFAQDFVTPDYEKWAESEVLSRPGNEVYWRVHTENLLKEALSNPGMSIMARPFQIFSRYLYDVANRASELGDAKLDSLMCRLTLYDCADPTSPHFDAKRLESVEQLAAEAGPSQPKTWTSEQRSQVSKILEDIAKVGLPNPRDLDVALDAIEQHSHN